MRMIENGMALALVFCVILGNCFAQNSYESGFYKYLIVDVPTASCWYDGDYMNMSFHNKYCAKEMMTEELSYYHVRQQNCFAAVLTHSGFARYGEFTANIGYARCFGKRVAVAMKAVYLLSHAESYGSVHSFTIDVSAFCRVTDKCALAVDAYNPVHLHYGVSGSEIIPMQFDLRLLYFPMNQLISCVYVHKTLPGELDVGVQCIWQPHRNLMLDLGFSNTHLQVGAHVPFRRFIAAVRCQWHYRAGFSPQCQLFVKF